MDDTPGYFDPSLGEVAVERARGALARRDLYEFVSIAALVVLALRIVISVSTGIEYFNNGEQYYSHSVVGSLFSFCEYSDTNGILITLPSLLLVWWRVRVLTDLIPDDAGSKSVEETEDLFTRIWWWRRVALLISAATVLDFAGSIALAYAKFATPGTDYGTSQVMQDTGAGGFAITYTILWAILVAIAVRAHRDAQDAQWRFEQPVVDTVDPAEPN